MAVGILHAQGLLEFDDPANVISGRADRSGVILAGLEAKLRAKGVEVIRISSESLKGEFTSPPNLSVLYVFPLCAKYFEDLPKKVRTKLEEWDERGLLFNPLGALIAQTDKRATTEAFKKHGVAIPETLISSNSNELAAFVKNHRVAILKPTHGAGGGNILFLVWKDGTVYARVPQDGRIVELPCEFKHYTTRHSRLYSPHTHDGRVHIHGEVVVQEVIQPEGRWNESVLKVYVVDGRAAFGVELTRSASTPEESIITYANAEHRLVDVKSIPKEAVELAVKAAAALGLRACLVDLIKKNGGWVALETNGDNIYTIHDRGYRFAQGFKPEFDFDEHLASALAARDTLSDRKRAPDNRRDKHVCAPLPVSPDPFARAKGVTLPRPGQAGEGRQPLSLAQAGKPNKITVK